MAMTREQFFECSFRSGQEQRTAHVRAWTAADARRMFADMLAADGIQVTGKVTVVPMRYQQRTPLAMVIPQLRHASHS